MAEVALERVTKVFESRGARVTALTGVDLRIGHDEFVAIVGASGCGKSTLLNLVAGFEHPTSGTVRVDGAAVTRPGPDRGVVFQQSALFPWLTVRQNIAFGPSLAANRARTIRAPGVDQLLKRVGLAAFADHFPSQLSGGMRQRAAIASVLTIDPGVLLMDEPFGALDALTRSLMQDFLLELWEENRKTVLLVTHDIGEAVYLADRLVIMAGHPGRVREIVPVDLPRPRRYALQAEPEFIRLRDHVTRVVREEAAKAAAVEAESAAA
ncbi:MAG: ABC transporter ATP-binding protein [Candidatus Odyssella sp.]|nr:ABC transporter ATP-binding protein [Candidatus Odyssella sp.]